MSNLFHCKVILISYFKHLCTVYILYKKLHVFYPWFQSTPSKNTARPRKDRTNPFPAKFSPSEQHVRNADIMLQCENCDKWRLLFATKKLPVREKDQLTQILQSVEYTCGLLIGKLSFVEFMNKIMHYNH